MSILGYDLGTANSSAFVFGGKDKPRIIVPREAGTIQGMVFPSYVEFDQSGQPLKVGRQAYDDYRIGTTNTIVWGSKRLIGISYEDAKKELRHLDYTVNKNADGTVVIAAGAKTYTPVEIATMILEKIKKDALDPVGHNNIGKISGVVVSHPAYFDGERRRRTLQAAQEAFKELPEKAIRLVPEPVAAALGYGLQLSSGRPSLVCVIDLGAGTLDIVTGTLSSDSDGRVDLMPDPALGNASFGGMDIDGILLEWAIREYRLTEFEQVRHKKSFSGTDTDAIKLDAELRTLRSQLELAKIRLSNPKITQKSLEELTYRGELIDMTLTRDKIEELMDAPLPQGRAEELIGAELNPEEMARVQEALAKFHAGEKRETPSLLDILRLTIQNSLAKGKYAVADIDYVLLVGGPMNMPCIRKAISEVFAANDAVTKQLDGFDTMSRDELESKLMQSVARGASLHDRGDDSGLEFHYAVLKRELEWRDGKTYMILDDKCRLSRGEPVPVTKKGDNVEKIRVTDKLQEEILLLEGREDTTVPGSSETHWKRSERHPFLPLYNNEGEASYTVTLEADENKIVTCLMVDNVSRKTYSYHVLPEWKLESEKYWVGAEPEAPPEIRESMNFGKVAVKDFKGLRQALDMLSLQAMAWLGQRHEPEQEQKRPKITQLAGTIPVVTQSLDHVMRSLQEQKKSDEDVVTDPQYVSAFVQGVSVARDLIRLVTAGGVTHQQVEEARNTANFLFHQVTLLRDKGVGSKQYNEMLAQSRELEMSLNLLPDIPVGEVSTRLEDIANYTHVFNLSSQLRATINKVRASLGMPRLE